jgi:XK-related protein
MSSCKIPRTRRNEPSSVSQEGESVTCQPQDIGATLTDSRKLQVDYVTVDGPVDATDSDPTLGKQLIAVCVEPPEKNVNQVVVTSTLDKFDYQSYSYSYSEIFYTLLAIGSYIFDVGSDIYVAFVYHNEGEWWWFGLTVSFVVIPSFIISCFSLAWYIQDHKTGNKVHPIRWIPRLFMLFLQLGPLIRLDTIGHFNDRFFALVAFICIVVREYCPFVIF